MSTVGAALRPLRIELIGVAGVAALLLLAAGAVAARLLAFNLPAGCLDPGSGDPACAGRQFDAIAYQAFAGSWLSPIAYVSTLYPALAGIILGIAAVAKELDQRTAVLAWSVGPSRGRWLLQRVIPLLALVIVIGIGSAQLFVALMRLNNGGMESFADEQFRLIPVIGFGPMGAGVSAFGITVVVGAMLGRLLPGLLAAGALVIVAAVLIQLGNERLMAGESLVADVFHAGPGMQVDSLLRTPDGRIIGWDDAFPEYVDPESGQPRPGVTEMARFVPSEIYPQVAARYVLFHVLAGLVALTLAFVVVERRSP